MEEKPSYQVGESPQGQVVVEAPRLAAPGGQSSFYNHFGVYGEWLGDPERRYGRLRLSRDIPAHTKLEMLRDPVIALCMGFIGATLVRARRVIECTDAEKQRFFEAMFREWEQEFILQASIAIAMGSCGLVKRFEFRAPKVAIGDEPAWNRTTTPYIVAGFDQVYPIGSFPKFDDKRRKFKGMDTPDGPVDVFFSLWLTFGQARAFGAYEGSGRLENAYKDWWMKHFARDLYMVYLQRNANPVVEVDYPPGKTGSVSHQDIAIATGDSVRSGATVALPSGVYDVVDQMTGDTRLSGVRKWALSFLESGRGVEQFHTVDDHHDKKMAMGMLIPSQAFMDVTGGDLGGPTSADKLTNLAEDLLLIDAADLDRHLNEYVFPAVARANFSPDSPPVLLQTTGLDPSSRREMYEIIRMILGRQDVSPSVFDLSEAMRRLGIPIAQSGEGVVTQPMEPAEPESGETPEVGAIAGGGTGSGWHNPPKGTHGRARLSDMSVIELRTLRRELQAQVKAAEHTLDDVIEGRVVIGVEGAGGQDMTRAKAAGLYTVTVKGVPIYAKARKDAKPLVNYLRAGGEYGSLEFSRLLGYTQAEAAVYKMLRDVEDELGRRGESLTGSEETANPSDRALRKIAGEVLPPLLGEDEEIISEDDVKRAVRRLQQVLPEAFEGEG